MENLNNVLGDLKKGHGSLAAQKAQLEAQHASVKERLDNIEALFGDATNRQTKELKGLKSLHDKHAAVLTKQSSQLDDLLSHKDHHASMPERMAYLEQMLGDSADKHAAHVAELHKKLEQEKAARDKHHGSVKDMLAKEQDERGGHHASINERVDYLENVIGTNADKHAKELEKLARSHKELTGELKAKGDSHEGVTERVSKLEKALVETAERQAREAKATKAKFESFSMKLSVVKEAWGSDTPRSP